MTAKDPPNRTDPLWNPRADIPCGTDNPGDLLPTPAHYDCAECRTIIRGILRLRIPLPKVRPTEHQGVLFDDLRPRKARTN